MITRRKFLHATAAGATTFGAATQLLAEAPTSGAVMPTKGSVVATRPLPTKPPSTGAKYRPPYHFGMGGTQMGNCFAPVSDAEAEAALEAAWAAGVRHFDTSPFYGYGLSERRLGRLLRNHRPEDYVLSTKVGRVFKASTEPRPPSEFWKNPAPFSYRYDYSAEEVRRSVEDSLQRLGVPKIDVVYVHDVSPDNEELGRPWQEVFDLAARGAMPELTRMREEGLIKAWGFGINRPDAAIRTAETGVADPDVVLLACHYSLVDHQAALDRTFPPLAKRNISVVVGTPLNAGFLAGRERYNFDPNIPAAALEKRRRPTAVADRFGVDLRTAALQFASAPPIVSAIIPGARSTAQVQANVESMKVQIPGEFWDVLRRDDLIAPNAPIPA